MSTSCSYSSQIFCYIFKAVQRDLSVKHPDAMVFLWDQPEEKKKKPKKTEKKAFVQAQIACKEKWLLFSRTNSAIS